MILRLISMISMLCLLFECELAWATTLPTNTVKMWSRDNSVETKVARKKRKGRRKRKKRKARARQKAQPEVQTEQAPTESTVTTGISRGRSRVDFDAMNIKGQTTKAGEVQILERKDTELKSMVRRRNNFRDEIILSVFPEKADSL